MGSWRSVRELPIRTRASRNTREGGFFRVWFLLTSLEFILCGLAFGLQPVILIFYFLFFYFFFKQYQSRPSSSASYSQGQSPRHTSSPLSPEPPVQRAGSAVRTNGGRTQSARSIGTQTWRVFIWPCGDKFEFFLKLIFAQWITLI